MKMANKNSFMMNIIIIKHIFIVLSLLLNMISNSILPVKSTAHGDVHDVLVCSIYRGDLFLKFDKETDKKRNYF